MDDMNLEELKETSIWQLYEQGRNFNRLRNMYSKTDLNYRMYNGDQWDGIKLKGIETVQFNFIKPIVKYKLAVLHSNNYAINYSSENFENQDFRKEAERICELLNKKAAKVWDKNELDQRTREASKDAAINSEGYLYSYIEDNEIKIEVIKKNNVLLGNENDGDIQSQPYILIKRRKPIINIVEEIQNNPDISDDNIKFIIGDNDTFEESGDSAKQEKDLMCTVVTKLYKEKGTVHYSSATRWVELEADKDSGMTQYQLDHFIWEDKEGDARGIGEVEQLIPNQLEANKNIMRSIVVAKNTAYPQKVVRKDRIANPSSLTEVGGTINVIGNDVEDVSKIVTTLPPAQMSSDVEKLRNELIQTTRELAGAGEVATGQVNPEQASGKAILAVQQASQQPLTEQLISYKAFIERVARIWLELWIVNSDDGLELEETLTDETTGEEYTQIYKATKEQLEKLKASVKVDITPKSAFDKYAQELSIESLLKEGYFNAQKLAELKVYAQLLDDDSVMPKQKLLEAIEIEEEEQKKIAMINQQAQMMQQRVKQFLNNDPESQASQMAEAQQVQQTEEMGNEGEVE